MKKQIKRKSKMKKGFYSFPQNKIIADYLQRFAKAYSLLGKHFRSRAYKKALTALEMNVTTNITSGKQVRDFKGVGEKIVAKIDELIETGTIQALEQLESNPMLTAYDELTQIHGVGPAKAKKWISENIYSIADLKKAVNAGKTKLTKAQKLGLDHFDELHTRISQYEMDIHRDLILTLLKSVNPEFEVQLAGSYRRYKNLDPVERKKNTSGDIDVLITHKSVKTKEDMDKNSFLKDIAKAFEKKGYSLGRLTLGKTKYSAVIALPKDYLKSQKVDIKKGKARHLDIRLFPQDTFVYSLFHFTGSGPHNMRLRAKAIKKGYSLTEYGLFTLDGERVEGLKTEAEIYKKLGQKYIPPENRD